MKNHLLLLFFASYSLFSSESQEQSEPLPWVWSEGEPVWEEGETRPPKGYSFLVICARKWGIKDNNPDKEEKFREFTSIAGHAWLERIPSEGDPSSVSAGKDKEYQDKEGRYVTNKDWKDYKNDKDTIRISYIVTDEQAEEAMARAKEYAMEGYNLFIRNCVNTTDRGACTVGLDKIFETVRLNFEEEGLALEPTRLTTPSSLHAILKQKVGEYNQKFNPLPSSSSHKGNFGGISLSKRAELCLNLEEIHGALFDITTGSLILVGKKPIQLPHMRLDDLAVAMQSIYGLKGNPPDLPGISIEPGEGGMRVRYFGETRNTEFGKVLFEGDLMLKRLLLGEQSCEVPQFQSMLDLAWPYLHRDGPLWACRHWIVPEKISLTQSEDGSAMVFQEVKMRCLTEKRDETAVMEPAEAFAQHFTDYYEEFAVEFPILSEVKRLGQITGVVKWLYDNRIPFDPSFFQSYIPHFCSTPDTIALIKTESSRGVAHLAAAGGILFPLGEKNFSTSVHKEIDVFKQDLLASRPDEDTFSWEFEQLSAVAVPVFQTRKTGNCCMCFADLQHESQKGLCLFRFYDSFNEEDHGLGRGWTVVPFYIHTPLQQEEAPPVLLIREKSQHWIYHKAREGLYQREDGRHFLLKREDGTLYLSCEEGAAFFDHRGNLTRLVGQKGVVSFCYEEGKLSSIHSGGEWIQLFYEGGHVCRAEDSFGRMLSYSFDEKGLLKVVADEQGPKHSFCYDVDLRLTHIFGPQGEKLFQGRYDESHRLISQRWWPQQWKTSS